MKKTITFIITIVLLMSCGSTKQLHTASVDEDNNLVGIAHKSDFEKAPFATWFHENYKEYELDTQTVNALKPLLKDVKIKAVMATWCGDSRREIPHFYKLLDAIDYNYDNLQMICVNRDKVSSDNEQEGLYIQRVPTFIFYKNGKEINRFVEYAVATLEKDFLKILQEKGYKHAYFE